MIRRILVAVCAALLVAPFAARAESELSLVLQGGGVKYNQSLSGATDLGAEYGARLGIMPTPILGVELGYLGSQSNVKQTLNSNFNNQRLITNAALADVRLNLLPGAVTPYVFGGYGVTNVKVDNEVVSSEPGLHGKTVGTVPFGGGIDFNAGAFKIGGRFQYNYLMTDQIVRDGTGPSVTGRNADFYGVSVDLGASFH